MHQAIAAFLLDGLSKRTAEKIGAPLNVGDLAEANNSLVGDPSGEDEQGREPVELLARILAHIGHRIPFFSKVEKRLEGTDAKSGFASDLVAFIVQLWHRNRPVMQAAMQAQAARNATADTSPPEGMHFTTSSTEFPMPDGTDATVSGSAPNPMEVA